MRLRLQASRRAWSARAGVFLAVAALAMVAAGCSKGTYAVDIFPEQHYHQSYKSQEPPRLSPPDGAVPITGKEVQVDAVTADAMTNPLPRTQETMERAAELYRVNCSMCHGPEARGDGPVGDRLVRDGYVRPPDLLADATMDRTDGSIYYFISSGILVMPRFNLLLNEEERWSLVHYLRYLGEQQ